MRALGRTNGYVVVQPTAPLDGVQLHDWTPGTDDAKVWTVVGDTRTALLIDPKRIHFMGFSQGGAFTWRVLCAHADVVASVAPVAAADAKTTMPYAPPYKRDCPFDMTASPSQQIPVLQMHGTADGLVPFSKGTDQRDVALAAWGLGNPTTVESDTKHTWTRYTNSSGLVFEWIQHDYLVNPPLLPVNIQGHCLPGGDDLAANAALGQTMWFSCAPPNAFVWGQAAMSFFIAHPRP
jgi:polyhydroxybutyrate depolymerase